jgi:hypothetical protein
MYRRILIALCLVSPACTAQPNRLEEASRLNEAAAAAELAARQARGESLDGPAMPPAPPLARHPVILPPAPEGIDAALWRDIGWFPADSTDIGCFVDREFQALARWMESTVVERFPVCGPLFAGVERTYMVHQGGALKATSVFYGAMTRAQERVCMQAALGDFGATGEQRGDLTILAAAEGPATRLAWFGRDHRDHGTVVILEGDAPLEGWTRPAGTLADQPALVRLVAKVDRGRGGWSVGLRDYGTAVTGVESTGYTMAMTPPRTSGETVLEVAAQLEFATPEMAKRAELGAAAFERAVPRPPELGIVLTMQAEGTWLKVSVKADLSAGKDEAITAWLQQVLVKLQANVAARADGQ